MNKLRHSLIELPPSANLAARIEALHRRKAADQGESLEALGGEAQRSRSHGRFAQFHEQMEALRLDTWLTPLGAADLQAVMGLTRDNADKRIQRYREFLADRIVF